MNENLRQVIHDQMAKTAAQHTAARYQEIRDGGMTPVNGWLAWRAADKPGGDRP